MSARLRRYEIASIAVVVTAVVRFLLIPLLGNRFGFDLFLISTFVCSRYLGFGPSVFALLAGALPVTIFHFVGPDLHDPYFLIGLVAYFVLGAIVVSLEKSEHDARAALQREIRERTVTEGELRDSQQQLQLAIEAGQLGTWQLDLQSHRVKWSGLMESMHGYAPGTFGGTLADAIAHNHPEDQERIMRDVAQRQAEVRSAYRVADPAGRTRWIQGIGKSIRDDAGEPVQMLGVCLDVTEQKEAEIALRQAEEKFRIMATHAPVGIFQTDPQGRCLFVNETWCATAGATYEDALGDGWQRFLHPEDRQRIAKEWQEATSLARSHVTEFRFLNQQTGIRSVIASAAVLRDSSGMVTGYVGTTVDVTRRKAAEDAVRTSEARWQQQEERLRLAVESADIGTFDFNPITGQRQWSDRAKIMFGLSPDADVTNVSFLERVHPEDRERAGRAVQQALEPDSDGKYDIDLRLVLPDESVHWFIAKGQAFFEGEPPNRRAIRFVGTVVEVTDRKVMENALQASEHRLQAILNNTSAVIYLKDWEGRYLMINRRYEELFHISQQQIIGKTDADVFPSDVVAKLQANDRRVQETGQPSEFEEVVPHADGPHTYVSIKFPIYDPAAQCNAIGGISTDISDRKKVADALEVEQEVLRHTIEIQDQERQLVAYEIHDGLVQFATGALMQLEAIRDRLGSDELAEQIENVVGILRNAVDEGRRVINGIRTPVLDDCGVVAAVQQLVDEEDRAHVNVDFVNDDDLGRMAPSIEGAVYHITREALTNVYKHSQSKNVRVELGRIGDRVRLEVRDWGVGFFRTDGITGIHGLRGMAERARIAGGQCTITSAPGGGTQVVVDLPYIGRN